MTPIHEEELSALLDGELDATRAAEVRRGIRADPRLEVAFAEMSRLDVKLRATAEAAAFTPALNLSKIGSATASRTLAIVAGGAALLGVRFLPKVGDAAALGIGFQAVAGVGILLLVARLARAEPIPGGASPWAGRPL